MDDPIAAALRALASDDDGDPQGAGDFQDGGTPWPPQVSMTPSLLHCRSARRGWTRDSRWPRPGA